MPELVRIVKHDTHSLTVNWNAPAGPNATSYVVEYSTDERAQSWPQVGVLYVEQGCFVSALYRVSYMSAHVLLNLFDELGKSDKMRGLPSILLLFRTV